MNQHGLSRHIPPDVALQIRRNSKFGCVVPGCRNAIYEYEHIDPEYKDAKWHDPATICLTCPTHNPRKVGNEGQAFISKMMLQRYYDALRSSDKPPPIRESDFFSHFDEPPTIRIGNSSFSFTDSIININGEDILSLVYRPATEPFEPSVIFSGTFKKPDGDLLFEIRDNVWYSPTNHWDVRVMNGRFEIHDDRGILFRAEKIADANTINITHLDLWYPPFHAVIKDGSLFLGRYDSKMENAVYFNVDGTNTGGKCGIYMTTETFRHPLKMRGLMVHGDRGIELVGNGIYMTKGGGVMSLRNWSIDLKGVVETEIAPKATKTPVPQGAHYFVTGKLLIKKIRFPNWVEDEFWLNGQQLSTHPASWGQLTEDGEHLYYVDSGQEADFALNSGFIGFYADDFVGSHIHDQVFNVIVERTSEDGTTYHDYIRKSEALDCRIISEIDPATNKPFVPNAFAGCSPWRDGS